MTDILEQTDAVDSSTGDATETTTSSSKNLSIEKKIYRTYGFIKEGETPDKNEYKAYTQNEAGAKTVTPKPLIRAKSADGKAWESAEAAGNTRLNENSFAFYTVENEEGFSELVPDATQRVYLINRGIATIQTAKANKIQAEVAEDGSFAYDGQDIDLREELNAPPQREKKTENQKLLGMLSALSADQIAEMMEKLTAMRAGL